VSAGSGPMLLLSFARRGEEEAIRAAMDAVGAQCPGARWAAIGTPASAPVFRSLGLGEVLVSGDRVSPRQLLRMARAQRPQAAVIIYSGPGTSGHLKLELVALAVAAPKVYRFVPGEEARPLGRFCLLGPVAAKLVQAGARVAVGALVCMAALCWLSLKDMAKGGRHARRP